MRRWLRHSDAGASAVEYGLLVAGIAALIIATVFVFGSSMRDTLFGQSCQILQAEIARNGGPPPTC
jgi:pilus assembly protein Flp/PilA